MKVAAYQAPLSATGSPEVLDLIREQVDWCEAVKKTGLCATNMSASSPGR
jgi:hypothetical protein